MKKGFTLIELLAVIVILSIIALIAIPIIINIINDARESGYKRSIELYGKAIEDAIATYQIKHPNEEIIGIDYTSEELLLYNEELNVDYDGTRIDCDKIDVYENGTIYMEQCTVGGHIVDYTYGTKEEKYVQVYKPQYYSWDLSGTVGLTSAPENPSKKPPKGKNFYLGYDVTNGKVSTAYVCFKRINYGFEYCLKGYNEYSRVVNQGIIIDAYKEVSDTNSCSSGGNYFYCYADGLYVEEGLHGIVKAHNDTYYCAVDGYGDFKCDARQ